MLDDLNTGSSRDGRESHKDAHVRHRRDRDQEVRSVVEREVPLGQQSDHSLSAAVHSWLDGELPEAAASGVLSLQTGAAVTVSSALSPSPMSGGMGQLSMSEGADEDANEPGLTWRLVRVRALGLPLPLGWFGGVRAREFERDGRYRFDVRAALPGIGLLVHYQGWLDVEG